MEAAHVAVGAVLTGLFAVKSLLRHVMRWDDDSHWNRTRFFQKLRATAKNVLLCLYAPDGVYQHWQIGAPPDAKHHPVIILVTHDAIRLYPNSPNMREVLEIPPASLRWYSRPPNTHLNDHSDMWLHYERDGHWHELTLYLRNYDGERLLDALETLALPLRRASYRRLQYGPVLAHPAQQAQTGEWSLLESLSLYLMPLYLVILRGDFVERAVPLDSITLVASIPRLDATGGVVRFRVAGEDLAYALDDYEDFAAALAEAAKASLEQPLEIVKRKGKKVKYEDEEYE